MFGSSILDVAIGIVFIYLLLSLVCTAINEAISSFVNQRGKNLFEGIKNLLNDPKFTQLAQQLYTHGLVAGISQDAADPRKPNRLPSYMPSKTFALAMLDILGSLGVGHSAQARVESQQKALDVANAKLAANPGDKALELAVVEQQAELASAKEWLQRSDALKQAHMDARIAAQSVTGPNDIGPLRVASAKLEAALSLGRSLAAQCSDALGNVHKAVESLPEGHTKETLLVLIGKTRRESALVAGKVSSAEEQLERFQQNVESWYNEAMDRIGGWYKRWTQRILLVIAAVLVLAVNADTIMLAKRFARDDALRASVVAVAEKSVRGGDAADQQQLLSAAAKLGLPLGWVPDAQDPGAHEQLPVTAGGWLLKLSGLLLTMLACSLGAPFWFDTLSKFINLRGAGTPPGEGKKSAPRAAVAAQ
jgi:hypothetical protein